MANETARKLRKATTPHEAKLWPHLRDLRKLGFHFRRQVPIDRFIVDFACYHPKVVVELDGGQHGLAGHGASDRARDAALAASGFRVVRVWNNDVDTNLEGVFDLILSELQRS
jgi:very-short-patch-repair endonuclease